MPSPFSRSYDVHARTDSRPCGGSSERGPPQHLFAVIISHDDRIIFLHRYYSQGASSLCLLVLLSVPLLRRPSYEIFLRMHQALAALFAYSIWRHLPADKLFPRLYLYISAGLFLFTCTLQCGGILYRNGTFRYGHSRGQITQASGTVQMNIRLSRPLKIDAGQYISLWIPSVSFWSFLQSHPFVVTSWTDGKQESLDLFIEPHHGLTRELLGHAGAAESRLVLFGGPHGISAPVSGYETVVMIASGFGIAAHLPYLKQLIYGYNARKVRARRIHLVWQLSDIGKSRTDGALAHG